MIKHASIVPLIGGETIGSELAFGEKPTYMMSYEDFAANDSHARNYYSGTPYYLLDKNERPSESVDVIVSVSLCWTISAITWIRGR